MRFFLKCFLIVVLILGLSVFFLELACSYLLKAHGIKSKEEYSVTEVNDPFIFGKRIKPPPSSNVSQRPSELNCVYKEQKKIYASDKEIIVFNNFVRRHSPKLKVTQGQYIINNEVIYNYQFSTDEYGRRTTVYSKEASTKKNKFLLLLGGSYPFGMGVNDNEHLGSQLTPYLPEYKIYNYGISGGGLSNTLALLSEEKFPNEILEKEGIAIYVYTYSDIKRLVLAFSQVKNGNLTNDIIVKQREGSIVFIPPSDFLYPLYFKFTYWLGQTSFAKYFNFDFPALPDEDLDLAVMIFLKMQTELKKHFHLKHFYVVNFPGRIGPSFSKLRQKFEKNHIEYLDFSDFKLEEYISSPFFPCDNHPQAEAYRFMAPYYAKEVLR